MTHVHTLLTHPGGAHKDEFLACCVLLAAAPSPIPLVRREPTPADLADAGVAVIDVGHTHDPIRRNFDHHQLPRDYPPTCALSLILQHLGLYGDARAFCDWVETVEWFDCRGPHHTARWLGVERDVLNKLYSPIDGAVLRRFAAAQRVESTDTLHTVMRWIGTDILDYVRGVRARLDFLAAHAARWSIASDAEVVFVARTEPLPADPSAGVDRFIAGLDGGERIIGTITPDRRGAGYGLSRHRDNPRLDFTRIALEPDVHFAHAGGFVAKTSATDPERLRQLMTLTLT